MPPARGITCLIIVIFLLEGVNLIVVGTCDPRHSRGQVTDVLQATQNWFRNLGTGWGKTTVKIHAEDGKLLHEIEPSLKLYDLSNSPAITLWPAVMKLAPIVWRAAPLGRVELKSGFYKKKIGSLHGFRGLWNWAVENCGFPKLP